MEERRPEEPRLFVARFDVEAVGRRAAGGGEPLGVGTADSASGLHRDVTALALERHQGSEPPLR